MNLADMAKFITDEIGVYDAESTRIAKTFLNKEYRVLWDKYPWSDTTGYGTMEAPAGTAIVNYPPGMERLITLRATNGTEITPPPIPPSEPSDVTLPSILHMDSRLLDPVDSTFLIESYPRIFEERGYVRFYEEMTGDLVATNGTMWQRQVRLYPIPIVGASLLFYGKMICPGFVNDIDISVIRNIDNVLIAYAYFDFLQRQRQYAKAKEKLTEAKELETNAWNLEQQQANQPRRTKATTVAGNTLAEMTDAVCALCGQWTPDYRLIIREFLRRNYQTLYDLFLWPESVLYVRVPFTNEQVIMPPYVDKVLGIRGSHNMRMFPADSVLFLDIAPQIFEEIGDSVGYTVLTPIGVSSLPVSTQQLVFSSSSQVDRSKMFIRGEILASGIEITEEITLNGHVPVTTTHAYDIPITVAKDVTFGDVTVNSAADNRLLAVIPANMRELKHQRLWFLPNPDASNLAVDDTFTCLVLAKRLNRPLLTDQDSPIITGAQQVLIAAAAADLYRKLEKHDQANAMQQKADGSMAALKAKNTDQAASAPRFVPQVEPRAYVAAGCGVW